MLRTLLVLFCLGTLGTLVAQTGCPGCIVDLPELATDTIFISPAPNGTAGMVYDEDLSFRLPISTTPVNALDGMTPAGINLDEIDIVDVAGLPVGLSWEASAVTFAVADMITDGCVKFCGTPLLPGLYEIEVVLEVRVSIITTSTSVFIPLLIDPAQAITDGFTLENTSGCGEVITSITNNVPSEGVDGFHYTWDFGNGFSSTEENPEPQTYSEPGVYTVDYQAIVDTAGFFLTQVTVLEADCNDLFSRPDIKIQVFDENGEVLYTAPLIENTDPPLVFDLFLPIDEEQNYSLHVIDDDNGLEGQDALCGVINFNSSLGDTLSAGPLSVALTLINPQDTVASSGTITVYEVPAAPQLSIVDTPPFCAGTSVTFEVSNYDQGLTWFQDSSLIADQTTGSYLTGEEGTFFVSYANTDGCSNSSAPVSYATVPNPAPITLVQENNLLRLADESNLPENFSFTWAYEGQEIFDADVLLLCTDVAGEYSLTIVDEDTGCSTSASISGAYDPNLSCTTSVSEALVSERWQFYPNPMHDYLLVEGTSTGGLLLIYDATGRQVHSQQLSAFRQLITTEHWGQGLYYYQLSNENGALLQAGKLLKQ